MGDAAVEEQTSVPSDTVDETVEPVNELDRAIEELNGLSEAMGPSAGQSSGSAAKILVELLPATSYWTSRSTSTSSSAALN